MAEPTLTLAWADLQMAVGDYLGFGADPTKWSADQTNDVDAAIQAGYRRFLSPEPTMGLVKRKQVVVEPAWEWSFLRPLATMTAWADLGVASGITVTGAKDNGTSTITASAAAFYPEMVGRSIVITGVATFTITGYTSSTVIAVSGDASGASAATFSLASEGRFRMVDAFGGIDGRPTFDPDDGWTRLIKKSEGYIRALRQAQADTPARPRYYAVVPIAHDPTVGQRWDLYLWPVPDSDYPLTFRMIAQQDKLSATNKYPLGGGPHGETILEHCLAAAEEAFNRDSTVHRQAARRRLEASIDIDARQDGEDLGYCGDGQVPVLVISRSREVTFEGVAY